MKLQDYNPFITIRELFGIFLPGAIVTIGIMWMFDEGKSDLIAVLTIDGKANSFLLGLVFLLVSYFFGHLIFQLGSYLDKIIYDPLKDVLFEQARLKIVKEELRDEIYKDEWTEKLYAFDWSLNRLRQLEDKGFYNEVEAIIADAKFFRASFLLGLIGSCIYEFSLRGSFSNLYFFIVIVLAFVLLRNLYKLDQNENIDKSIIKTKKEAHYDFWKWSLLVAYICLVIIHILQCLQNYTKEPFELKYIALPLILSIVTATSLFLYIHIRQKSCKKMYSHIIFLDRKLISDKNATP